MSDIIISPIFYMGNKKKLIKKGLINLFPENINRFYDLCAGSAVVSMNTNAKQYIVNDIDKNLQNLYHIFKFYSPNEIVSHIKRRICEYGLAEERTKRNQYFDKNKLFQYKKSYMALREHYNHDVYNDDIRLLDFYTLMFYSFSQQFRFNSKGEFNMPIGNDCFSRKNEQYIKDGCAFFGSENVYTSQFDFRKLPIDKIHSSDFIYIDPPYYNTTATYNENGGWNLEDEMSLFNFCESLNKNNIRWGLSNIFKNKNINNEYLIKWCNKNNWNVFMFDKFTYMACGKGNSQAKEVYICNY